MADDYMTEMPWGTIVKRTAQATAGVLVILTSWFASVVRSDRRLKEESEEFRWTDKTRWE